MKHLSCFAAAFIISLLFTSINPVLAQVQLTTKKHSFEVSYGFLPVSQIKARMSDWFSWGSPWELDDKRTIGALNFGYTLDVSKRMQIGVMSSYLNIRKNYIPKSQFHYPGSAYQDRTERIKSWSFMPKLAYKWYDREDGQVYSSLLLGIDSRKEPVVENSTQKEYRETTNLAYHLTIIGAKLGTRRGCFVELGFGFAGLGTAGLFMKL